MNRDRIRKSRKRAMLRGVDAMLDLIDEMLAPVKEQMRDMAVMKSIAQPLELMWPARFDTRCNPFAKVGA